jgi:hypothetical protein
MGDVERYRAFAQLCRDMATSQTDVRERDRLLRVCAVWERAAQRADPQKDDTAPRGV